MPIIGFKGRRGHPVKSKFQILKAEIQSFLGGKVPYMLSLMNAPPPTDGQNQQFSAPFWKFQDPPQTDKPNGLESGGRVFGKLSSDLLCGGGDLLCISFMSMDKHSKSLNCIPCSPILMTSSYRHYDRLCSFFLLTVYAQDY